MPDARRWRSWAGNNFSWRAQDFMSLWTRFINVYVGNSVWNWVGNEKKQSRLGDLQEQSIKDESENLRLFIAERKRHVFVLVYVAEDALEPMQSRLVSRDIRHAWTSSSPCWTWIHNLCRRFTAHSISEQPVPMAGIPLVMVLSVRPPLHVQIRWPRRCSWTPNVSEVLGCCIWLRGSPRGGLSTTRGYGKRPVWHLDGGGLQTTSQPLEMEIQGLAGQSLWIPCQSPPNHTRCWWQSLYFDSHFSARIEAEWMVPQTVNVAYALAVLRRGERDGFDPTMKACATFFQQDIETVPCSAERPSGRQTVFQGRVSSRGILWKNDKEDKRNNATIF